MGARAISIHLSCVSGIAAYVAKIMERARRLAGGLIVFPALKMSDGPPAEWLAIAIDRRLSSDRFATGSGPTGSSAEAEALAKLGATPNTIRAALASSEERRSSGADDGPDSRRR